MQDPVIDLQFRAVQAQLKGQFEKAPDLNAILFLIGMNELGRLQTKFSKEQKQDLMHVAICTLLTDEGIYIQAGRDDDRWPRFERTAKLAGLTLDEQEALLKKHIVRYFEANEIL